jgi:hypothetical protein
MHVVLTRVTRENAYEELVLSLDGLIGLDLTLTEPEDRTFTRDLAQLAKLPHVLQMAHSAGLRGEPFTYETQEAHE